MSENMSEKKCCPPATANVMVHAENQNRAVMNTQISFGPRDVTASNSLFWEEKATRWEVTTDEARKRRCTSCEHFDTSPDTNNCLKSGIFSMLMKCRPCVKAGKKAYCSKHKFIATEFRVCNNWEYKK